MAFNLAEIVREGARWNATRPAVIHDGGTVSYAELDRLSDNVAAHLVALGIEPGDPVGIQLPNVPEFVTALYGILKAGAVAIPFNVVNKGPEIAYFLSFSGAKAVITTDSALAEAQIGAKEAGVEHVFVHGGSGPSAEVRAFEELTAQTDAAAPYVLRDPTDTAVLLYTSGTTGKPKAVKLTHFQLFMNARAHVQCFDMDADSRTIAVMPLFHALGLSGILNANLLAGGAVILLEKFDATRVLESLQEHRATVLHGVPTMYHALLNHPDVARYDRSSLRACGSAGAAIAAELLDGFEREFGVLITEMYGLTEAGPLATANLPTRRKPYSIGTPIWGTDVQIWGSDGRRLGRGKDNIGEIVIRGHNTMAGYLNNEAATDEALADGWLHSGDLGYEDEDGFLFIVDRKKELIIRGGYNVYPREVEEVLYQHPDISEAAVLGRTDDRLGEEVHAFVTLRPERSATPEDIIAFVKQRMAVYKYPRTVTIIDALPKSSTGKILKRQLVDIYW
ncbi:long-chain-fatty-acid--CoA ligase [Millisia brevis]|uniref:long-chain-fatty-acid--CoA ligase n=1 Tax=Millisia brevis TaxID=264148 RepID=UPI000833E5CF|nr:long-chain fatty acid--CoA ligase [Millisia brevis]